jgi:imidazole glycerol phosphate synthase subunit HisF
LKILRNFLAWQREERWHADQAHHRLPGRACGRVVKGVQFVDLVDAGDPATQAARHAREGADEIVLLDITATHEGRQTLLDTVRRTARDCLSRSAWAAASVSAKDAEQVFEAGADKVSINSAALADRSADQRDRRSFGAQAVVVAIDARRDPEARRPRCAMRRFCARGARPGPHACRVGARGRAARRGRDSADLNGRGRNARGV